MAKNKVSKEKQKRRVLISFLGTGPSDQKGSEVRPMRVYRDADYIIDNKIYNTSFVAAALARHYEVDNIFMVGTVHSMWEELYRWFHDAKSEKRVEDDDVSYAIYNTISEECINANHKSELRIPHQKEIEEAMGGNSKVVLVKYGITESEIRENINHILGLKNNLKRGDELIVDITHSFRSLPIFIMNLLVYLQDVSSIGVEISHIHYGMLEIGGKGPGKELENVPVVDLKSMMEVQKWITGAYNFKEFGNAYLLAKLMEKENRGSYASLAKLLKSFSEIKNLNYFSEFRSSVADLEPLCNKESLPELGKEIIVPVMEKFVKRFSSRTSLYEYQFRMAEWHYNHHNYGYAFINLVEAALTFCCELIPDDIIPQKLILGKNGELLLDKNGEIRAGAKRKAIRRVLNYADEDKGVECIENLRNTLDFYMNAQNIKFSIFNDYYWKIDFNRNTIAHDLDRYKPKKYSDIIDDLDGGMLYFRSVFQPS